MKPSIFQLCALFLATGTYLGCLATPGQARLGETREELIERYGEPLRESQAELPQSEGATTFLKDTVEIAVEFKNGKAWMVTYRTHKLSSELEAQLRDANDGDVSGMADWHDPVEHLDRSYWSTLDGKYFGVRYFLGNSQIFRFCNLLCRDALIDARKAAIDSAISGFRAEPEPAEDEAKGEKEEKEENPF